MSLPRPPDRTSVLLCGGPDGGGAAGRLSLMESLALLLQRANLSAGACRQEMHRVPPAVRVAVTEAQLQLLPQEAHRHLQDVGFLQLGVGLLLVKLLLQDDFELLDAAIDAVPAHFLHNGFS